ncbi:hypothetical protein, partial [Micromonospora sp. b486]|uniref:hypothetical protein n=1 Tax=Micromonospora sp. b486 TaxID=3053986 RepID=UPI00259CDEA3
MAITTRCRCPPDSSCGYAASVRRGSSPTSRISSSAERVPPRADHLGELGADAQRRVQRRQRVLVDHRDLAAHQGPAALGVQLQQVRVLEADPAAYPGALRSRPITARTLSDLPEPDSPTRP